MSPERPRRSPRPMLWTAISALCVFGARLLSGPDDSFGGPVLHYVVLGASGAVLATSIVLLVRQGRRGREER
ncbi:hypothetical protein [Actinoplanes sp. DH11]|uniref:hypothetical protein n=1 Tax=Actinoplanes sp. DH11 TaxID=2857011 RepID=UPI001E5B7810|nr:hypothetical protein [Actinoplanes sp. DH11]